MTVNKLVKGKKYRVVKKGCHLTKLIPKGNHIFKFVKLWLFAGEIIVYQGREPGRGIDNVPHDIFSRRGFTGWFYPNKWGVADKSCLENHE